MNATKLKQFKIQLKEALGDPEVAALLKEKEIVVIDPSIPSEAPMQNGFPSTLKHSVNLGDLVAAMGCAKKFWEITKRKVIIAQTINQPAAYYPGAVHPTVDEKGTQVCVNTTMFDMVKPLIESQPYIDSFVKYMGQKVDVDFDVVRGRTSVNMPHGPIQGWIPLAYPDLLFNMAKPWIEISGECPAYIKGQVAGKVLINFTERYREEQMDYYFLKNYSPDLIFAGTEKEHWLFCSRWDLNVPRLEIKDFLEYAHAIKEARFFMGNQSLGWNLSQAMGVPRIVEMCRYADNCFPGIGEDSYGYFFQVAAEYFFRSLYNKTMRK